MGFPSYLVENLKEENLINISKLDNHVNHKRHLKELQKVVKNQYVLTQTQSWYPRTVLETASNFTHPHLDFEATFSFCVLLNSYLQKNKDVFSAEIDLFISLRIPCIKLLEKELKECCKEIISNLLNTKDLIDEFEQEDISELLEELNQE